ncbi:Ca2+:Cation Antiporter [Paratrimastix pyriformis]|uniref:Ca2+:Cation Antiporter n=1 Tax=Paratrimastix pyriformis TaxID=342808 RepID=A0ABQ8UY87_9EUKA|nr:Ca2+:Cation Antiporter [Paratrimastix pyriformis]
MQHKALIAFLLVCAATVALSFSIAWLQTAFKQAASPQSPHFSKVSSFLSLPFAVGGEEDDDCDSLRLIEPENRCLFVRKSCDYEGLFNYLDFHYCSMFSAQWLSYVLQALLLAYLFMLLGSTASDFFVPALQCLVSALNLSENVAGVTFLALGNGAPDLFSQLAGAQNGAFQLALGEALGSGLFIVSIVLGAVGLIATFNLDPMSLAMDASTYLGTVVFLLLISIDSQITWVELALFPVLYAGYVVAVIVVDWIKRRRMSRFKGIINEGDEDVPPTGSEYIAYGGSAGSGPPRSIHGLKELPPPHDELLLPFPTDPMSESFELEPIQSKLGLRQWVAMWSGRFVEWTEWREKGWFGKTRTLLEMPFTLFRMLTIPHCDKTPSGTTRLVLNCIWSPIFTCYAIGGWNMWIVNAEGVEAFPLWAIPLAVSVIGLPVMLLLNRPKIRPKAFLVFTFWNFVVSIVWLNLLANELVVILQSLGVSLGLSSAIVGSTVLAAGNSVGDLVANLAVAREGQPRAAVAACYASPLLNALLGLFVSSLFTLIQSKGSYHFEAATSLWFVFSFLLAILVLTLIVLPANRMRMTRPFAVALFLIYCSFVVIVVLVELHVFGF